MVEYGDERPDDVDVYAYNFDGTRYGDDGNLYNINDERIESPQEERDRIREEWYQEEQQRKKEAQQNASEDKGSFFDGIAPGPSEPIDWGPSIGETLAKGAGIGAAVVGVATVASAYSKTGDVNKALSKGIRNALCFLGIVGILAAVLVGTMVFILSITKAPSLFAKVIIYALLLAAGVTVFGLIRVMMDKTFFIKVQRRSDMTFR